MTPAKTYTTNTISEVLLNYGFSEYRVNELLESMGKVELLSSPAEPEFVEKWALSSNPLTPYGQAHAIIDLVESKVKPLIERIESLEIDRNKRMLIGKLSKD